MASLTNEQIEAKKQQLKGELAEAGALPLDDDDLDQAAGGAPFLVMIHWVWSNTT